MIIRGLYLPFVALKKKPYSIILKADGGDGVIVPFKEPYLQACAMFLGEALCLVVFCLRKCRKAKNGYDDPEPRTKPFDAKFMIISVRSSFFLH